ncbi:MAG: hypothetical protein J07HX64_00595 [halophilic archaeon J07HX64]|nr:MAG: hypothetical protein J07HX64_00595 [halophilic archaeon J07HX64]
MPEFVDVVEDLGRVPVDDSGEFADAFGFVFGDCLQQFEIRRPEHPAERFEIRDDHRRGAGLDGLDTLVVDCFEGGFEGGAVGRVADLDV